VIFTAPQNWMIRGGKDRLQLDPPNTNFAQALIQAMPRPLSSHFDEPTLKALEQQVMSEVPPGAQSVQLVSRLENPVVMAHSQSCGFLISYQTLGQTFQRSVIFVNCDDQQLVFRLTAPKTEFDKLNGAFCRSISSWRWIEKPAAPASGATITSR
jgi:hypothetical protein